MFAELNDSPDLASFKEPGSRFKNAFVYFFPSVSRLCKVDRNIMLEFTQSLALKLKNVLCLPFNCSYSVLKGMCYPVEENKHIFMKACNLAVLGHC